VREVFRRYTEEWDSLSTITRWLTATGIRTRTGLGGHCKTGQRWTAQNRPNEQTLKPGLL
jgi:hypothetical protein